EGAAQLAALPDPPQRPRVAHALPRQRPQAAGSDRRRRDADPQPAHQSDGGGAGRAEAEGCARMKRWSLPAIALALCACGGDLSSPFSAVAITYDVPNQKFKLAQVRLNTLSSLRHLRGSAGAVTAGGKVRVSSLAARARGATVDSLRASFTKSQPAQVEIAWRGLSDIVYPEAFASLELLSTYYNMERARAELANLGLTTLPARTIIAHADLTNENGLSPLPDGELYYAPMATFFAPATTAQQAVPP